MDMKIVQTYKQDKNKRYSNMVSKEKYIMFLDFKQLMYVCVCVCVCVCVYLYSKSFMKLEFSSFLSIISLLLCKL